MTATAEINQLAAALKAAGTDWPKPVAQAVAERSKLAAAVTDLQSGDHNLMGAVADAFLEDRSPLVDPDVVRLCVAHVLVGDSLERGIERVANTRIAAAIVEHVDEITATLKEATDSAGEVLARSHEVLGDADLKDSALMMKLGAAAATAWGEARQAEKAIRLIGDGIFALAALTGTMSMSASRTLMLCDPTLEQYEQLGHRAESWSIVQAGVRIDLATSVTIRSREEALNAARAERTQRAAGAYAESYQRERGIGVLT